MLIIQSRSLRNSGIGNKYFFCNSETVQIFVSMAIETEDDICTADEVIATQQVML